MRGREKVREDQDVDVMRRRRRAVVINLADGVSAIADAVDLYVSYEI